MVRLLVLVITSCLIFGACKSKPKTTEAVPKTETTETVGKTKSLENDDVSLIGFKDNKAVTASGKMVDIPGLTDDKQSTYFLVRHAEKTTEKPNPGLTDAGMARAAKLAALLDGLKIDQVMSTDYKRTQDTAAPLAKSKKLSIQSYDPGMQKDLFTDLSVLNKQNVLVVGHSNTIPQLANILIGKEVIAEYDHEDYSNLLIISISQPGIATYERFQF